MNTENKMYTCALCGKSYNTITERANCELTCAKKQEVEAKKAAEAKKKVEQEARHARVTKMIDEAYAELDKYMKDYGSYNYDGNLDLSNGNLSLMKLLHHFLF